MANSITKIYQIELKFSYEPADTITEDDLNVSILRGHIKKWIKDKVAHVTQGNLVVHIVGDISES